MDVLSRAGIPFLVGGAFAFVHQAGIDRSTKDLDIFVRPSDVHPLLNACKGMVQDAVIGGENRDTVTMLGWISPERAAAIASDPSCGTDLARLSRDPAVRDHIRRALEAHNHSASSSNRVSAFVLLEQPPSLGSGEITDKAYVNQRAVLKNRAALVDELYRQSVSPRVIAIDEQV